MQSSEKFLRVTCSNFKHLFTVLWSRKTDVEFAAVFVQVEKGLNGIKRRRCENFTATAVPLLPF